jgi:hypothetical protein
MCDCASTRYICVNIAETTLFWNWRFSLCIDQFVSVTWWYTMRIEHTIERTIVSHITVLLSIVTSKGNRGNECNDFETLFRWHYWKVTRSKGNLTKVTSVSLAFFWYICLSFLFSIYHYVKDIILCVCRHTQSIVVNIDMIIRFRMSVSRFIVVHYFQEVKLFYVELMFFHLSHF